MLNDLGYLASFIVLVSLLMSSVKRLRWINLIGSMTFAVYGFLIGSIPVAVLNIGTSLINIYYLTKMSNTKEYFQTLEFETDSKYFQNFLDFYQKDLFYFFSPKNINLKQSDISFYVLRNLKPAGIFIGTKITDDVLRVDFDYVVPEFRDFRLGKYIYQDMRHIFIDKGLKTLVAYTNVQKHEKYLIKMGFKKIAATENNQIRYELVLAK